MENVQYTFVKDEGNLVFRSSVNSFGLDHVTDKDLSSFYVSFSQSAYFDTGLLPVDGSGLLSIRTAGNHTQIAYQHKPGMYYINWGSYEGDRDAIKYYVAQPYRIVIADLLNGNIYGARTFYSPIPITHPLTPLYHVNLPNINCKGYRGNGVGWICLYHNEDITAYPFNEKLAKILDRCSGTEAYNDQNMKETDGPRFYQQNFKPSHLSNPEEWQAYSDTHGYEWTLDPDLWIPVLVKDRDHQDQHYKDGQPLTFADALIGNYQAYYTDSTIPKPVNAIVRPDYSLDSSTVFNWFKQSYNSSQSQFKSVDPYSNSLAVRESISTALPVFTDSEDEETDDDYWSCNDCGDDHDSDTSYIYTYNENIICVPCAEENYGLAINTKKYHNTGDLLWCEGIDSYIYPDTLEHGVDYKYCFNCGTVWHYTEDDFSSFILDQTNTCNECIDHKKQMDESPF